MNLLLKMIVEQTTARLRKIQARIGRGKDSELSDYEVEKARQWAGILGRILSLSGEELQLL